MNDPVESAQPNEVPLWATLQAWNEVTDDTPRSVIRDRAREIAAAPGPQQPDEVCGHCGEARSLHLADGTCTRWSWSPAAPSAQPDEVDPLDPEDRDWVETFVDAPPGVSVVHVFPAQPVRDTGEGRR